jgi:hypothetical protein
MIICFKLIRFGQQFIPMKNLLSSTLLLFTFASQAQIQLTKTDFATGGDTVRMSQANDNGYDVTLTGAAYTWDFSDLIATSQVLKDYRSMAGVPMFIQIVYGNFAAAKYQASYSIESTALPVAQISSFLPVSIENIYQFSKRSDDSLTSLGFSMTVNGNDLPFKSDTIETRYDFPLAFGNTHFSRGYTLIDFNPILDAVWNQHRTRTTTVDGYGSITTPYGTFDALRIKHDITETDSIYYTFPLIGATWIPIPMPASHEYEWWTNGEKEPILRITTSELGGNENITAIEYRDNYIPFAGIEESSINISVYPNPVSNELSIDGVSTVNKIQLIDSKGAIVFSRMMNNEGQLKVDVSSYASGTYQIIFISNTETSVKTFVKK